MAYYPMVRFHACPEAQHSTVGAINGHPDQLDPSWRHASPYVHTDRPSSLRMMRSGLCLKATEPQDGYKPRCTRDAGFGGALGQRASNPPTKCHADRFGSTRDRGDWRADHEQKKARPRDSTSYQPDRLKFGTAGPNEVSGNVISANSRNMYLANCNDR